MGRPAPAPLPASHAVLELLTSASLAVRCFREGEPVLPWRVIDGRWDALRAAVEGVPAAAPAAWDVDCWAALRSAALLTARAPRNWWAQAVTVLGPALEIAMRLNPEERQRALEGLPDDELPFHLRD